MELERFREPNGEADGYTEYYMPNGNGYGMKKVTRKRSCKKYTSYILNIILFLMLLIFILMYTLFPNCDCVNENVPTNGESRLTYQMDSEDSFTNGKHLTMTTQADQVFNTTVYKDVEANEIKVTTEHIQVTEKSFDLEKMSASDEKETSSEEIYYLLPGYLHPTSYRIVLIPHFLTNMTTTGNVSIDFICNYETNVVTLNARDLVINEMSIVVKNIIGNEQIEIDSVFMDDRSEMLKITLLQTLKSKENYNVVMSFTGLIQDIPKGLYRTQYSLRDKHGLMVNTLFSPNEARSVFPCFDEPMYKARFSFTLGRLPEYHSLSNMNMISSTPAYFETKYEMDTFEQTPPMSTYLTAFAITEFETVHPLIVQNNITFAGHSESVELSQMTYILRWMERLTTFFGKYFNISYPLPKMDIIAVPEQFFHAMENWGLITFRKNLAYVNEKTTEDDIQHTIVTLAHEIAHQWFGNLVTPKWWDNLWLKEGFSTYFGYFAINEEEKDWNINDKFQIEVLDQAFKVDALATSIPLSKSVSKTSTEIFDIVSYDKGASMIRMMSNFLGAENFRKGVISYLNRYSYSNADQDDLWTALEENIDHQYTGDIDLKTVMESWTLQAGYPVVHVTRQDNDLVFYQERLLLNGNIQNDSKWWIPITYTTQSEMKFDDTRPKLWLSKATTHHIENFANKNDWIIVNLNQTGYYRVNYDNENWVKIINSFETFPNTIKAQLIGDSLFLAQASVLKYDLALSITLEMTKELNYLPWKAASNHLFYIGNLIKNMPAYGNFRLLVLNLLRRVYSDYENTAYWFENLNDPIGQMHSVNIINLACYFDLPECLKSCYDLYHEKMATKTNVIPHYMRHVVYCSAVKYGGQRMWDYTYNTLKSTNNTEERRRLLHALGCSKETWLLTKTLSILLQNNEINLAADEVMTLFDSVMANSLGNQIGVSFLRDQWTHLLTQYESPFVLYRMISNVVTFVNAPYYVSELKTMVDNIEKQTKEKSTVLRQTIESAENNIVWMNKNYVTVASFLDLFVEKYGIH